MPGIVATRRARGNPPGSGDRAVKVFVSYRRAQVDEFFVGRLRDSLRAEFGRSRVFVDVYDLPGGSDFSAEIERQISASDALVLVIDERWNTQRLADAHDVLAKELRLGLARTMVIPVVVGGAVMPTEDQLPEEFRSLAHIQ